MLLVTDAHLQSFLYMYLLYLLQHHDLPDQNLNAKVMNHATAIQIITFNLRIKGFLAYTIFFVELSSIGITATLFPALHGYPLFLILLPLKLLP
ncbi:hypothetical protein P029_03970 [Anaplasma phagocytophilum str. Norway variant2]|uniref:Uncharacterized protein n=1 Tax=Anaplasma phagocytophilum str. Norway variant2 TaxID=1392507 RepID=A0A168HFC3_ANAPH|nr:hypothetical protein P029_03970 [Anaplasma phagocytophilum str. Norway variant2]